MDKFDHGLSLSNKIVDFAFYRGGGTGRGGGGGRGGKRPDDQGESFS